MVGDRHAPAERDIQFGADQVLQERARHHRAAGGGLPHIRLFDQIANHLLHRQSRLAAKLHRLAGETRDELIDPIPLERGQIGQPLRVQLVEERHVSPHLIDAEPIGAPHLCADALGDAVVGEDTVARAPVQPADLPLARRHLRFGIERQGLVPCAAGHHQPDVQRAPGLQQLLGLGELRESIERRGAQAASARLPGLSAGARRFGWAASRGSRICSAMCRTTGTATPSPVRWYASLYRFGSG